MIREHCLSVSASPTQNDHQPHLTFCSNFFGNLNYTTHYALTLKLIITQQRVII